MSETSIYDQNGKRLYLNAEERAAFLAAAKRRPARDRTLCETLHYTGCRPSEILEITPARIDLDACTVTLRSLKKGKDTTGAPKIIYRAVPVPSDYLDTLNTAHGLREAQQSRRKADKPIWQLSRKTVWKIAGDVMKEAGIPAAPHRTAKGLRHGFAVNAVVNGIPLHMLQKWMGHAQLATTAARYANAIGKEEQDIASRMWS